MKRDRAFTLVELLVGLALTLLIAVLLMSVVSGSLSLWQRGRNQIDTTSNARQVLTRISDEIKGAVAATGRVQFAKNLVSLADPAAAPVAGSSENVFFVAPYPNSGAGDLCVIAYRHNSNTHELQRAFIKSDDAWSVATNKYRAAGYTTLSSSASPSPWRTVAQNVLEFEARSYSQSDLDTNATPAPSPAWDSERTTANMAGNVPRRVIIRLRVIDDKSVARLDASRANATSYNLILAQSARTFSVDIDLLPPH